MGPLQHHTGQALAYKCHMKWYCSECGRSWPSRAFQQCVKIFDQSICISLEGLLLVDFWKTHSALPKVPTCQARKELWATHRGSVARSMIQRGNGQGEDPEWWIEWREVRVKGLVVRRKQQNLPNRPFSRGKTKNKFSQAAKTWNFENFRIFGNLNFMKGFLFLDKCKSKTLKFTFLVIFSTMDPRFAKNCTIWIPHGILTKTDAFNAIFHGLFVHPKCSREHVRLWNNWKCYFENAKVGRDLSPSGHQNVWNS